MAATKSQHGGKTLRPGGAFILLAVALASLGALTYAAVKLSSHPALVTAQSETSAGRPDIGGAFTLTNHHGEEVTDETYRGQIKLIYFGFTFCPDVCPTQLIALGSALEALGEEAEAIQPLFITIDPERDSPEVLADYVPHFHSNVVGLTGSADQIRAVADAYYVSYAKEPNPDSEAPYLMAHSSIVYVMGRDGGYLGHFTHATKPQDMAEALRKWL